MLKRVIRFAAKDNRGITGLETAIILIAFVVVAAVFAYTALSAGLFSTQKSQEAIYAGLEEAQSTMELKGGIIATANQTGSNGTVGQLSFVVSKVLGGEAIDFTPPQQRSDNNGTANSSTSQNTVVITYTDRQQAVEDLYWTLQQLGNADEDYLLEDNERFQITVGSAIVTTDGGNLCDALNPDITVDTKFDLTLMSAIGAVLTIERTMPGYIDQIINLH